MSEITRRSSRRRTEVSIREQEDDFMMRNWIVESLYALGMMIEKVRGGCILSIWREGVTRTGVRS